jgi:hypothetical protein
MTDFATLAANQRRTCRTREAMLRQQHAQASMSGKSAQQTSMQSAAKGRFPPFVAEFNV